MAKETYHIHGQWNAICDVCGVKRKSGELQERWDGLMVCRPTVQTGCWEPRHPQDFIKPPRGEQPVPWTRPEATDTFIEVTVCNDPVGFNGVAGVGTAGCAITDTDNGLRP